MRAKFLFSNGISVETGAVSFLLKRAKRNWHLCYRDGRRPCENSCIVSGSGVLACLRGSAARVLGCSALCSWWRLPRTLNEPNA